MRTPACLCWQQHTGIGAPLSGHQIARQYHVGHVAKPSVNSISSILMCYHINIIDGTETNTTNSYDIDMDELNTALSEARCNFFELLCINQDGNPPESCFGSRDIESSYFYITRMDHVRGVYHAAGQKRHEWAVHAVRTALVKNGELDLSVLEKLIEGCERTSPRSCCDELRSLSHHGASDPMTTDDLLPPRSSSRYPTATLSAPRISAKPRTRRRDISNRKCQCPCGLVLEAPRDLLKHLHEETHTRCLDCGKVFTGRRRCNHECNHELLVGIPAPPMRSCIYGCELRGIYNNLRRHERASHIRCTLCGFVCSAGNGSKMSVATPHPEACGGSLDPLMPDQFLITNKDPADELVLGAARSGIPDEIMSEVLQWPDPIIGRRLRAALKRQRGNSTSASRND